MAITITNQIETRFNPENKMVIASIELDDNYPVGGYEYDAETLHYITNLAFAGLYPTQTDDTPGYCFYVNKDDTDPTKKCRIVVTDLNGVEIADGTDLSDIDLNLLVIGLFRK